MDVESETFLSDIEETIPIFNNTRCQCILAILEDLSKTQGWMVFSINSALSSENNLESKKKKKKIYMEINFKVYSDWIRTVKL